MILTNVLPEKFVGREEVLDTLAKRVESLKAGYRQNVALMGQKLCGKTSILQYFLSGLKDSSVIPVYIEVLNEPLESFARKFIGTMLFNLLKDTDKDIKDDIQFLISSAQARIPKTAAAIKEVLRLLEKGENQEAYSALFNLTCSLKEETGRSCIIILDEFHNLSVFNVKSPFAVFGKKIMVQKDTMYVVTSSQVSLIKRILKEKLDLLFGNFEIIEIKDFDCCVSKKLLERRLENIKLQEELKDFLISFTDGRPFYLDLIASRLTDIWAQLQFKWLNSSHIAQALEDLLFNSKGVANQYFQNLIYGFAPAHAVNDYLDILSAIADGKKTLGKIRSSFRGKKSELTKRIDRLTEESIIGKNGYLYYFNDRVFEFWLKYVFNKNRFSLVSIFQDRSNMFKKEVEDLIASFVCENKKTVYDRLRELLISFDDEVLDAGDKSIKFPKFISAEIERIPEEDGTFLTCANYAHKKSWVLRFTRQYVDEGAMILLTKRFKAMEPAPQKKILIAVSGIDTNAMLIAKNSKVWVWDRETLNLILSLYGKFKILN